MVSLSPQVIESRRMSWAGNTIGLGRREMHAGYWWGNVIEGDHLENLGVDGNVIIKRISEK
jgi:hypothetical protein